MAPKKAAAAPKPKAAGSAPQHASYQDMIKDAIINLKERNGSSRQAIKKYIKANNSLGATTDNAFNSHINKALGAGDKSGVFERPKGPSGPVKLKKGAAKAAAKPAKTEKPKKAKATGEKKPKAAPKPKAAATKKTTAKPKANAAKSRTKAPAKPADAPAVEEKPSVVLGKTKSGRVTKSKAPQAAKKAAPKKTATKKAAPKKSATPAKKETPA